MKIKFSLSLLLIFFVSVIIISCEDNGNYEFGDMQTGFKVDSVYKAKTDGLLTIKYTSRNISDKFYIKVLSDNSENPTTEVGLITNSGTITIPIKSNKYWEIKQGYTGGTTLEIYWTPINNSR